MGRPAATEGQARLRGKDWVLGGHQEEPQKQQSGPWEGLQSHL